MFRTLATTAAALPLALGLLNSFEDNADLAEIANNIAAVVEVDAGGAFDLGAGRTVGDALDSCTFHYASCQRF